MIPCSLGQPNYRDYDTALWDRHATFLDLSGKSLFLTGATGLIGTYVLDLLAHLWRSGRGPRVVALSRNPGAFLSRRPDFRGQFWLEWLEGDIASYVFPKETFDYLLHGAHIVSGEGATNPLAIYDATVAASRRVFDHALAARVGRVLLVSTGGVSRTNEAVGHPIAEPQREEDWLRTNAAYCEAKRSAETLATLYRVSRNLDVVIARPFSVVGSGLSLQGSYALGNFIRDALGGEKIVIQSDGLALRSYMYVGDMAVWLLRALVAGTNGRVYNVGSDQAITLRELAEMVMRELEVNKPVKVLGAHNAAQAQWMPRYVPDITRAKEELGLAVWTDLATSLRLTAASVESQMASAGRD